MAGTFTVSYQKTYHGLPERLAEQYNDLNFDNHCYLRIALDNTIGAKWDTKVRRPAYKHLSKEQLYSVLDLLQQYQTDKALLLRHNRTSLDYRNKWKRKHRKFTF